MNDDVEVVEHYCLNFSSHRCCLLPHPTVDWQIVVVEHSMSMEDAMKVSVRSPIVFAFGSFPTATTCAWSSTISAPFSAMSVSFSVSGQGVSPVSDSNMRDFDHRSSLQSEQEVQASAHALVFVPDWHLFQPGKQRLCAARTLCLHRQHFAVLDSFSSTSKREENVRNLFLGKQPINGQFCCHPYKEKFCLRWTGSADLCFSEVVFAVLSDNVLCCNIL